MYFFRNVIQMFSYVIWFTISTGTYTSYISIYISSITYWSHRKTDIFPIFWNKCAEYVHKYVINMFFFCCWWKSLHNILHLQTQVCKSNWVRPDSSESVRRSERGLVCSVPCCIYPGWTSTSLHQTTPDATAPSPAQQEPTPDWPAGYRR